MEPWAPQALIRLLLQVRHRLRANGGTHVRSESLAGPKSTVAPMVNDASVGTTAEPFELVLELGKIREFARATWSTDPEVTSGKHIPPTFLMVAAHWQPAEANALNVAGLDRRRSLHATQEFTFHGTPPSVGTRLKGESRVDRFTPKKAAAAP
jgi:hypothetical protein